MTFNVKKCQMLLFEGRFVVVDKAAVAYTLYGVPPVVVDSFKYLEVFVSSNFGWDIHIDDMTSRTYQRLGMIRPKRVLNKAALKVLGLSPITILEPMQQVIHSITIVFCHEPPVNCGVIFNRFIVTHSLDDCILYSF